MSLTLSDRDVTALCALEETLLSPLEHSTTYDWQTAIADSLARFFRADRSICTVPDESGAIRQASWGLDPAMAAQFASVLAGARPGSLEFRDPVFDQLFSRLASAHVDAWNHPLVQRVTGMSLEDSAFYHEVAVPAGVSHPNMASVSLPIGQGLLGVAYAKRGKEPFGDATLELCRLLVPVFKAGLWSVLSLGARRVALEAMLKECQLGILVRDHNGAEIYRNPALERMLATDPERSRILEAAATFARGLVALRSAGRIAADAPPLGARPTMVKTAVESYSLGASFLPPETFARGWTVVITIAGRHPPLPEARALRQQFGLTPREAEVALLLAAGASDRTIAVRLGISPHTASKHAEHIFDKLGVHSRKAFLLELTSAVGPAPAR